MSNEYIELTSSVKQLINAVKTRNNHLDSQTFQMVENQFTVTNYGALTRRKFNIICDLLQEYNLKLAPKHKIRFEIPDPRIRRHAILHQSTYDGFVNTSRILPAEVNLNHIMGRSNTRSRFPPERFIRYLQIILHKEDFIEKFLPPLIRQIMLNGFNLGKATEITQAYYKGVFTALVSLRSKEERAVLVTVDVSQTLDLFGAKVMGNMVVPLLKHAVLCDMARSGRRFILGQMSFLEHLSLFMKGSLYRRWSAYFTATTQQEYDSRSHSSLTLALEAYNRTLDWGEDMATASHGLWEALHGVLSVMPKKAALIFLAQHIVCEHLVSCLIHSAVQRARQAMASFGTSDAENNPGVATAISADLMQDSVARQLVYRLPALGDDSIGSFFSAEQKAYLRLTGVNNLLASYWPTVNHSEREKLRDSVQNKINQLAGLRNNTTTSDMDKNGSDSLVQDILRRQREEAKRRRLKEEEALRQREFNLKHTLDKVQPKVKGSADTVATMVSFTSLPQSVLQSSCHIITGETKSM